MSSGTEQISQEARSRTGWIIAAVGIALLAGVAYLVLGPIPGVAVVLVLAIAIILFRVYRRMFP